MKKKMKKMVETMPKMTILKMKMLMKTKRKTGTMRQLRMRMKVGWYLSIRRIYRLLPKKRQGLKSKTDILFSCRSSSFLFNFTIKL
jgi:hypothetical protein